MDIQEITDNSFIQKLMQISKLSQTSDFVEYDYLGELPYAHIGEIKSLVGIKGVNLSEKEGNSEKNLRIIFSNERKNKLLFSYWIEYAEEEQ